MGRAEVGWRWTGFAFALGVYLYTIWTLLYLVGWLGGFVVPRTIDGGPPGDATTAILVDTGLLLFFGVVHSAMARPRFKARLTRWVAPHLERSVYVLVSCLQLVLLFALWRPLPEPLWVLETELARQLVVGLGLLGWTMAFVATHTVGHFRLFGLRQAWLVARGRPEDPDPGLKRARLHGWIRHPMFLGFLVAAWAAPTMSRGHLLFAVLTTAYVLVGMRLEERDLERLYGDDFETYRREVGAFLPRRRSRRV